MDRITLKVSQEDIDTAGRGSFECPIARCAQRSGFKDASVGICAMSCVDGVYHPTEQCFDEMNAFVYNYDRGKPVSPITLELCRVREAYNNE